MIDLIPKDYHENRDIKLAKFVVLIGSLIVIVLIVFGSLIYFRSVVEKNVLKKKIKISEHKLEQVRRETVEVLKLKKEPKELHKKLEKKQEVIGDRANWALRLQELREILPQHSWLTRYQISGDNQFRLNAYSLRHDDIEVIIRHLKKSKYFNDIYVESTNKSRFSKSGYPQQTVFQYRISGEVATKGGD
ncbi:MAG: PilN domain-containing protein [Halanaerobacter sp.]